MTERRQRLREARSWPFDLAVLGVGLVVLAWALTQTVTTTWSGGGDLALWAALVFGPPLILVVSRFPVILDDTGHGSIEIGFDSSLLMFLLCVMPEVQAITVWSAGILLTQLTSGKRIEARVFNVGVGIVAAALAALVLDAVRGSAVGTPRELAAVAAAAAAYFVVDYVLSAVSISIDSQTKLREHLAQRGTLLAVACFVAFDLMGYLGAVVTRSGSWWAASLLVVPLGTLLVATRALTRGRENSRRLRVLLDAAVRAQTLYEPTQVVDALIGDARELLRLKNVVLRSSPPQSGEVGSQILRGKDGSWIVAPSRTRARATTTGDQQALEALAAIASDAFSRLQLTDDMVHFARHDPLTDLPNRGILQDRTAHALQLARRHGTQIALLFVDLDDFKPVNDRFGHAAGDRVLVDVAERLRDCTRASDTVARLGGDEFAVLFEDVDSEMARGLCDRILASLAEGVLVDHLRVPLSASIGIAYGTDQNSTEALLRHADLAMYEAKGRGKGHYVEYDPAMGSSRLEKLELIDALRGAVEDRQIRVVYQPVVTAETGAIAGVEALARWTLDENDIPPDIFIKLAEEVGLINALGDHVLEQASRDAVVLQAASREPITMSVNVAAQQLREPRFVDVVRHCVAPMAANSLILEITEREGIGDDAQVLRAMQEISDLGVRFAIDDFGIGFSSIGYLQDVPAHIIKADATLSRNIDRDERACVLLRSIANMGRDLHMDVVVEGIERETQLALVRDDVHAQFAQGFLMHRPMPLERLLGVVSDGPQATAEPAAIVAEPAEPRLDLGGPGLLGLAPGT